VVEAQASGLPVVGVNAGALRERVPPDLGRLGPVDDAVAFADNIGAVVPRRQTIGAAACAHVLAAGYGWERTFERLLDIYQSALAGHDEDSTEADSGSRAATVNSPSREELDALDDGAAQ
jgi:alpha-1,6-mannosyltransferase